MEGQTLVYTYLGELAAITASILWSASSSVFTFAGRQVGAIVLNRLRLLAAVLLVTLAHLLFRLPLPLHAEPGRWAWLALSGVIGLTIGDALLFSALVRIGPRLSMLINALNPAIATLLAWFILGEVLSGMEILGMALTLGGVAWVVLDRPTQPTAGGAERRDYVLGALFALGSATSQALALVIAKPGLAGSFPPLSATWMRMLAGTAAMWLVTLLGGQARATFARLRARPQAAWLILAGATAGPFLGVTMSMIAIQNANIGVASTLMGLAPVFLLPVGRFVFKERFSWQAVAGTVIAIVGVGLLF